MRLFPGPIIRLSVRHIRKRVYIPQPSDAYLNDRLVYDESEIDAASVSKETSRTLNDLALKPKLHVEDENFDVSLNSVPKQKLNEDKKSPKLFHFPSPEPRDRVGTDSADEGNRFVIRDESDGRAIKKLKKPLRVAKALNFSRIPLEKQAIFLFPGQGSQFVGMGRQLLDCDASRNLFEAAKHILGYDLLKLCLDGPKESLDRTVHCQPAVFVASLAAVEKLRQERPEAVENAVAAAGFSVGEYAALVFAKTLSFAEGLRIVQIRAEAMQKCSEAIPSGMVTVRVSADSQLGEALIHARRATMQAHHSQEPTVCSVANYLLQGMQVVGGDDVTLSFLDQNAREYNIEVVKRLPVSGAFHTKRRRTLIPRSRVQFSAEGESSPNQSAHPSGVEELEAASLRNVIIPIQSVLLLDKILYSIVQASAEHLASIKIYTGSLT
uniref:Malonyl-CoA:ACP transacylase (MAT) domain-containing protein n=1 Tax=Plectus sambesii TaxID=2011161 RepID=A0A914VAR7_9BILA